MTDEIKLPDTRRSFIFNCRLLAFLLPLLVLALAYIVRLIYPFGNSTVLVLDLNAQYVYFFEALRDVFIGEGSIFYSFERALSGEFLGIVAYYLASPLSFLVLLFPKGAIQEAIFFIIIIKCALCGLFAHVYLTKSAKIDPFRALIFSSCYALCSYGVTYASNTMWIDCMYLLPLIMLGIDDLIIRRKHMLYTISLALALVTSYYIGYMLCIFAVIYYFASYFGKDPEERGSDGENVHFVKSSLRFALYSITSALLASPMLLSALHSLSFGKNDFTSPDYAFEEKTQFFDVFYKMLPFSYDTVRPDGMPFVYASVLCLILLAVYFLAQKIPVREKVSNAVMLGLLLFSFSFTTIDLFWHGMQFPNWLNFRYSFVFSFIVVICAARALEHLESVQIQSVGIIVFAVCMGTAFLQKAGYDEKYLTVCVWVSILLSLVFLILLRLFCHNPKKAAVLLLCVCLIELFASSLASICMMDDDVGYTKHSYYSDFMKKYRVCSDYINESDNTLFRSENFNIRKVNDNYALDLNGISGSTSTLNKKVIDYLANLGYNSRSHFSNYAGAHPVFDSILGIKYVLAESDQVPDPSYEKIYESEKYKTAVFENKNALPLVYTADRAFAGFNTSSEDNPFELACRYTASLLGDGGRHSLFLCNSDYSTNLENAELSAKTPRYKYTKKRENASARVNFVITASHDGPMYAFFPVTNGYRKDIDVKYGERKIDNYLMSNAQGVIYLGTYNTGDIVYVTIELNDNAFNLNITQYFYTLNTDVFEDVMNKLSSGSAQIDKHSDTRIKGRVEIKDGRNMLLFTLPYDKNFEVYIDGEKTEPYEAAGIFTAVDIDDGVHEFEIKYVPREFLFGLALALFGVVILLALNSKKIIRGLFNKSSNKIPLQMIS